MYDPKSKWVKVAVKSFLRVQVQSIQRDIQNKLSIEIVPANCPENFQQIAKNCPTNCPTNCQKNRKKKSNNADFLQIVPNWLQNWIVNG